MRKVESPQPSLSEVKGESEPRAILTIELPTDEEEQERCIAALKALGTAKEASLIYTIPGEGRQMTIKLPAGEAAEVKERIETTWKLNVTESKEE